MEQRFRDIHTDAWDNDHEHRDKRRSEVVKMKRPLWVHVTTAWRGWRRRPPEMVGSWEYTE